MAANIAMTKEKERFQLLKMEAKQALGLLTGTFDLVFLDPPYGGTKSRYTQTPFSLDEFYHVLDQLNRKEVNWMLTFDGTSGERNYTFAPPEDLYKSSFKVKTGKSSFRKVIDKVQEDVLETVYLNYKSSLF